MKHDWEYKKLGEVASLVADGDWIESKDQSEDGIRLIQTGNIGNGVFKSKDDKPHYISEETFNRLGCTEIFEGDCLVSRLPDPVGRACIIPNTDSRMITAVDCSIIRFDKSYLPKTFVYYSRSSKYATLISNNTTGSTRKRISRKNLETIPIPVPPLPIQQQIVAELDKVSEIIEKKKQQVKELDNLAQSIFYDMFGDPVENEKGWEVKTMGDIGTLQRGSGLSKKVLVEDGYPCILYGQIHTRFGAYTKKHLFCIPNELVHTAKIAHPNDLIMAITSEDVEGSCKSTAWLGDYDIAVGSDAAIFSHNQNSIYVSYYTKTKAFYNEKAKYARGFKVTHISTKEIASIPIILPPLPLQQTFAQKIEAIEKQKELITASIKEAQTLFDARMDYWFGE